VDCVLEGIRESIGEATLRRSVLLPALLALAAIPAGAQQELAPLKRELHERLPDYRLPTFRPEEARNVRDLEI
jgi:hypothetical protein